MTTNTEKNEKIKMSDKILAYAALGTVALIGYKFGFNAGVKKAFANTREVGETYASIYKMAMKD